MPWALEVFFVVFAALNAKCAKLENKNPRLATQESCRNHQFGSSREDVFQYVADISTGIRGTSNETATVRMRATVIISNQNGCSYEMKVNDLEIAEYFNDYPDEVLTRRFSDIKLLRFNMMDGLVTDIFPSTQSTDPKTLNIQRGILSVLQVQMGKSGEAGQVVLVTDVSGNCPTRFIKRNELDSWAQTERWEKVKDLNRCTGHSVSHSNIDGDSYLTGDHAEESPILRSSSKCTYSVSTAGSQLGLRNATCSEDFLVRAFSSGTNAGAYVHSRVELNRVKSSEIARASHQQYEDFYKTSIAFDHNHKHHQPVVPKCVDQLESLLANRAGLSPSEVLLERIICLRKLGKDELAKVSKNHLDFDSLAQCGTAACLELMFTQLGKTKDVNQYEVMPFLAFIKEPTPDVIRILLRIHQQTGDPATLLLIGTLIHKMCKHRGPECQEKGAVGQVVEDAEYYLLKLLGKNCHVSDPSRQRLVFFALKGIGNMGRPQQALPLILNCVQKAGRTNISVAAVQALRRMELGPETKDVLRDLFTNNEVDLEVRMECFLMLMKSPSQGDVILARDVANDKKESSQLKSFLASFLHQAMKNSNPGQKLVTQLIRQTLAKYPLDPFDPSPSRFSKAFLHSLHVDRLQAGATMNGKMFFHPESFVPRSLAFNLTTHVLGYAVNALEVDVRMEGLEPILSSFLGKDGVLSSKYFGKMFDIPVDLQSRKRRNVMEGIPFDSLDGKVNMKTAAPQIALSVKVFGNDVFVLSLEDLPFLSHGIDNFNAIAFLHRWSRGPTKKFNRQVILMEASHVVPTLLGLPINLEINGSAVVSGEVSTQLQTANLLFGPKSLTGHVTGSGRLQADVTGRISVEGSGLKFHATTETKNGGSLKFSVTQGKEADLEFTPFSGVDTGKPIDVFHFRYDIYRQVHDKVDAIAGVPRRAKGKFCLNDIFESSSTLAMDICSKADVPIGYHLSNAPFYPLTGSVEFGVEYLKDPNLKGYKVHVKNAREVYSVVLSTVGLAKERQFAMDVGIGLGSEQGLLGLLLGREKRGAVLRYSFNNDTNAVNLSLSSNITSTPISLSASFFNDTSPTTLNRHVGIEVGVKLGRFWLKHRSYYNSTYESWSITTKTEYFPDRLWRADMVIMYEPQNFRFSFVGLPSNMSFSLNVSPALPRLAIAFYAHDGSKVDIRASFNVDLAVYRMTADFLARPFYEKLVFNAIVDPEKMSAQFSIDHITKTFKGSSSLLQVGSGHAVISDLHASGKPIASSRLYWNPERLNITAKIQEASGNLNFSLLNDVRLVRFLGFGNVLGRDVFINATMKNDTGRSNICLLVLIQGLPKFGQCFSAEQGLNSFKYAHNFLHPSMGTWFDSIILAKEPKADGYLYSFSYIPMSSNPLNLSLSYGADQGQQSQSTEMRIDAMGWRGSIVYLHSSLFSERRSALRFALRDSTRLIGEMHFTAKADTKIKRRVNLSANISFPVFGKISMHWSWGGERYPYRFSYSNSSGHPIFSASIYDGDEGADSPLNEKSQFVLAVNRDLRSSVGNILKFYFKGLGTTPEGFFVRQVTKKESIGYHIMTIQNVDHNVVDTLLVAEFDRSGAALNLSLNNEIIQPYVSLLPEASYVEFMLYGTLQKNVQDIFENLGLHSSRSAKWSHEIANTTAQTMMTLSCVGKEILDALKSSENTKSLTLSLTDLLSLPYKSVQLANGRHAWILDILNGSLSSIAKGEPLASTFQHYFRAILQLLAGVDVSVPEPSTVSTISDVLGKRLAAAIQRLSSEGFETRLSEMLKPLGPSMWTNHVVKAVKKYLMHQGSVKYDASKTFNQNLVMFFLPIYDVLETILTFDYTSALVNKTMTILQLPEPLRIAFSRLLAVHDYKEFATQINLFLFSTFKVAGNHKRLSSDLLKRASTVSSYLRSLSEIVARRGSSNSAAAKMFQEFLLHRDEKKFIRSVKDSILANVTGFEEKRLLEDLFNEFESSLKGFLRQRTLDGPRLLAVAIKRAFEGDLLLLLDKTLDFFLLSSNISMESSIRSRLNSSSVLNSVLYKSVFALSGLMKFEDFLDGVTPGLLGGHTSEPGSAVILQLLLASSEDAPDALGLFFKRGLLHYVDCVATAVEKNIPGTWKGRFMKVVAMVRQELQDLSPGELENTAMKAMWLVARKTYDRIVRTLGNDSVDYLLEDLKMIILDMASKANFGNVSLADAIMGYETAVHNKLVFLIRLLGQVSQSSENAFQKRFVKHGRIQYYDIYKSIWSEKLDSPMNRAQVRAIIAGLETRLASELKRFTGNFSAIVTLNNVLSVVKSLNYTDVNTALESIRGVDFADIGNMSWASVEGRVVALLEDIGQIRIEDESVNQYVKSYIKFLLSKFGELYLNLGNLTKAHRLLVQDVRDTSDIWFQEMLRLMDKMIVANPFYKFVDDLIQPAVHAQIEFFEGLSFGDEAFKQVFDSVGSRSLSMAGYGRADLLHDFWTFIQGVKDAGGSGNYLRCLLMEAKKYWTKALDEIQGEIARDFLADIEKFLQDNVDSSVHVLYANAVKKLSRIFETSIENSALYRLIRRSVSSEQIDIRSLLIQLVHKQVMSVGWPLKTGHAEAILAASLPKWIQSVARGLENTSIAILKGIEGFKEPIVNHLFITDPKQYLRRAPSWVIQKLTRYLNQHAGSIDSDLKNMDDRLRETRSQFVRLLSSYRETMRAINERVQSYLNNSLHDLISGSMGLNKYIKDVEHAIDSLIPNLSANASLEQQLQTMTSRSKELQRMVNTLQKTYLSQMRSNLTRLLETVDVWEGVGLVMQRVAGNSSLEHHVKVASDLIQMNVQEIVEKLAVPRIHLLFRSVDDLICAAKTNVSDVYKKFVAPNILYVEGSIMLRLPVEISVGRITEWQRSGYDSWKKLEEMFAAAFMEGLDSPGWNSQFQRLLRTTVDPSLQYAMGVLANQLHSRFTSVQGVAEVYQNYAGQAPSAVAKGLLRQYEVLLKNASANLAAMASIVPPSDLEVVVLRWLGIDLEPEDYQFAPLPRTAYLFTSSAVTFDGRGIFLPRRDIRAGCYLLLARDFEWGNFSIVLTESAFVVDLVDMQVVLPVKGHEKPFTVIKVGTDKKFATKTYEFPSQGHYSGTFMLPNSVTINSAFGLNIICQLQPTTCNITVAGYYHNKTVGFLGTNNVEAADDLRMADGKIATSMVEFFNSWQLNPSPHCLLRGVTLPSSDFGSTCKEAFSGMGAAHSTNSHRYSLSVGAEPFQSACEHGDVCSVASAFVDNMALDRVRVPTPSMCSSCSPLAPAFLVNPGFNMVNLVVLIKLTKSMVKIIPAVKATLSDLDKKLSATGEVRYTFVGYDGAYGRKLPHVQTGNGEVFCHLAAAQQALDSLSFDGDSTASKTAFEALKFASGLLSNRSSKVFVLFEDDESYTGSLRKMLATYDILAEKGITLNVVNKYKMNKNVLGLDSKGFRYLLRLPEGENLGQVSFPPADDFMALVRQTGGGVFNLKAFAGKSSKWKAAAAPVMTAALTRVIEGDRRACKACSCNMCRQVETSRCQPARRT